MTMFRRLARCTSGVAGLEAAIAIPVFLFLVLATVDFYNTFRTQSILDRVSHSIAHSLSLQSSLYQVGQAAGNCTYVNDLCIYQKVARSIYYPLDFSTWGCVRIKVLVSENMAKENSLPDFQWEDSKGWSTAFSGSSFGFGMNGRSCADVSQLTSAVKPVSAESLIVVEALYQYKPFILSANFWSKIDKNIVSSKAVVRPFYGSLDTLL